MREELVHSKHDRAAIGYGRDGFLVSPTIAAQWAAQVLDLCSQPGFAAAFMPGNQAPSPGELFRLPEHAATLEKIAATNGEAFYRGELAETMEAHSTANGSPRAPTQACCCLPRIVIGSPT